MSSLVFNLRCNSDDTLSPSPPPLTHPLPVMQVELGNLVHLTELHLDQNQLKSIPDSFGLLRALTVLRLDQNQLTMLPASLGQLAMLTEFSVRENYLREVPPEIGTLSRLTYLGLGHNRLSELPAGDDAHRSTWLRMLERERERKIERERDSTVGTPCSTIRCDW